MNARTFLLYALAAVLTSIALIAAVWGFTNTAHSGLLKDQVYALGNFGLAFIYIVVQFLPPGKGDEDRLTPSDILGPVLIILWVIFQIGWFIGWASPEYLKYLVTAIGTLATTVAFFSWFGWLVIKWDTS